MLTLLATLKTRLGIGDSDETDDDLLNRFIAHASGLFDRHCNRSFERAEDAEHVFWADRQEILLLRYPVETITSFFLRDGAGSDWVEELSVDYELDPASGVLSIRSPLGPSSQRAKIVYDGGYVVPVETEEEEEEEELEEGQTALPAEIQNACLEQCAYWYQNRDRLGITSLSSEGGAVTQFASLKLLPIVQETLSTYRRLNLV